MRIAQLSDLHCGGARHDRELLRAAVDEINGACPDLVAVVGDLSEDGYPDQLAEAKEALDRLDCPAVVTVPGNHDARHVGYLWFEEAFGEREHRIRRRLGDLDVAVAAVDSSKPDLDEGEVGRERYPWIEEALADDEVDLRIFIAHHHLVPIPLTGREANQVRDAGDVLAVLRRAGVDLVLSGHRHVPWVWPIAGMLLVHSGTVSTRRARGFRQPAYNVLDVTADSIAVTLCVPGQGRQAIGTYPRAWPEELVVHDIPVPHPA